MYKYLKKPTFFLISIFFFSICVQSQSIEPASKAKRPSFMYKPEMVRRSAKYEQKLGILPVIDSRISMFYGEEDDFYKDSIIVGLNRIFNLELRYSGLFPEVTSIKQPSSENPDIREIQSIGSSNGTKLVLITHLTGFNFSRTPVDIYAKGLGARIEADFANSLRVSFISQLVDVETGLILFAEEISRESLEYARSRSFESDMLEKMTKEVLKQSFSDLKILILENGLRIKSWLRISTKFLFF